MNDDLEGQEADEADEQKMSCVKTRSLQISTHHGLSSSRPRGRYNGIVQPEITRWRMDTALSTCTCWSRKTTSYVRSPPMGCTVLFSLGLHMKSRKLPFLSAWNKEQLKTDIRLADVNVARRGGTFWWFRCGLSLLVGLRWVRWVQWAVNSGWCAIDAWRAQTQIRNVQLSGL